ncbi:hypothetical protein [Azospirillum largimobile]
MAGSGSEADHRPQCRLRPRMAPSRKLALGQRARRLRFSRGSIYCAATVSPTAPTD